MILVNAVWELLDQNLSQHFFMTYVWPPSWKRLVFVLALFYRFLQRKLSRTYLYSPKTCEPMIGLYSSSSHWSSPRRSTKGETVLSQQLIESIENPSLFHGNRKGLASNCLVFVHKT